MRHDIPDFLWKIGTKVENLIQQHDALEYWRDHVRRWAPAENSPTDLVKTLYSRSLDAKYALLAAIHDLCFDADQAPPINPWPEGLSPEVAQPGISYLILKGQLLPDAEKGHPGLDESESDRLKIILGDVGRSLPARKDTGPDETDGEADQGGGLRPPTDKTKGEIRAANSSRADILRLRLKSLYDALYRLPTAVPIAEGAGLMQQQAILNYQIAELEKQLTAGGAVTPSDELTANALEADIPEASIEILEEHQSGLYGKVFKGRQTSLDRIVAVKIIRPDWPNAADAIEHAKAIVRAGAHTNIVTVYCVERVRVPGFDRPQPAMVMEWLDGENLGVRLGGPQFGEEQVRRICVGVLDGVEHMHRKGIAHGDLHLGNVIVNNSCGPKIIDIDPNKDNSLARLSTISRQGALQSDIEYCQNLVFRVFSHGPFSIVTRNRIDVELRQAKTIEDLRKVVERFLEVQPETQQYIEDQTPASRRFDQIRESFESAVMRGGFHELMPDRAVLAVCLVPETLHKLDRAMIHHSLPPLLHEDRRWEPEIDRHTEISLAEGESWKTVLDVNREGVIRAASTLAIRGDVPDKLFRLALDAGRAEHCIRSSQLQNTLVHSLRLWAAVMREWQVAAPFRLGVSLLAVQDWDLLLFDRELCNRPHKEPLLSADPIIIPSIDDIYGPQAVFTTLRPALDDIARAFGRGKWPLGNWPLL